MEYIDSFMDSGSKYQLELDFDPDLEQYWVTATIDGDATDTASLVAASDSDEIGELWLGQFPGLSKQVSKWAWEYL